MKKLTLLTFFIAVSKFCIAGVLTVSQNSNLPAQYTDINAAISAASPDDTIYIHATPGWYNYPVYLTKRLVLVGPGHHPKTTSGQFAHVNSIELYAGCNGSSIYGLSTGIVQKIGGSATDTVNLTLKYCKFIAFLHINFNYTSLIIENCLFDNGYIGFNWGAAYNRTGFIARNNIFGTFGGSGGGSISGPRDNSIIDHNVFIGSSASARAITEGVNCTVSNNIFFGRTIDTTGSFIMGTGCIFLNNITHLCSNTLPTPGNSGSGNLNADPQFLIFPTTPSNFAYTQNFRVSNTSPALNAATDGTDIGVYGNNITFSMTGEPDDFSVMRMLDIYNTTVPFNGILDIRMKSTVPVQD